MKCSLPQSISHHPVKLLGVDGGIVSLGPYREYGDSVHFMTLLLVYTKT